VTDPLEPASDYLDLVTAVEQAGFHGIFIGAAERVLPRVTICTEPSGGNSFWVAKDDGNRWWLATMGGYFFRVPETVSVARVCISVLRGSGMWNLPPGMVTEFGLIEERTAGEAPLFQGRTCEEWHTEFWDLGP